MMRNMVIIFEIYNDDCYMSSTKAIAKKIKI